MGTDPTAPHPVVVAMGVQDVVAGQVRASQLRREPEGAQAAAGTDQPVAVAGAGHRRARAEHRDVVTPLGHRRRQGVDLVAHADLALARQVVRDHRDAQRVRHRPRRSSSWSTCSQPWPNSRSGSRWLPSAHSFHDLIQSSRSSPGRADERVDGGADVRAELLRRRAVHRQAAAARARRVVPVGVHGRRVVVGVEAGGQRQRLACVRVDLETAEQLAAGAHRGHVPRLGPDREPDVHRGVEAVLRAAGVLRPAPEEVAGLRREVEAVEAGLPRHLLPPVDELRGVRELLGPEDVEHRAAVDPEVALVAERGDDGVEVRLVVLRAGVGLLHQHPVGGAVPDAGPRLVGPAEAERDRRLAAGQHLGEGRLQDPATAAEPVVPVAERLDAVLLRQRGLGLSGLRQPQVVEAEVRGQRGLPVTGVERARLGGVRPLGEPRAPPRVVLGDRVELRQEEGDGAGGVVLSHQRAPRMAQRSGAPSPSPETLLVDRHRLRTL